MVESEIIIQSNHLSLNFFVCKYCRNIIKIYYSSYETFDSLFYRKACLSLIRKMVHYSKNELIVEICSGESNNFPSRLVEVIATVLDSEVCYHY